MPGESTPRRPLHERSDSQSNENARTLRLVPNSPQLLGQKDDIFSRTPLPTHPSHILSPGKGKGKEHHVLQSPFHQSLEAPPSTGSSASSVATKNSLLRTPLHGGDSATGSPVSRARPKPVPKKRLQIHKDNKTFSLVPLSDGDPQLTEDEPQTPRSRTVSAKSSYDLLPSNNRNVEAQPNSTVLYTPGPHSRASATLTTPTPGSKQSVTADPISSSPWNYQLVGGLRKVPPTPDLKHKATDLSDVPPLPETLDVSTSRSHDLSTKPSFQSTQTATTTSENTNYKVYRTLSRSASEAALASPSSSDSNYQVLADPSPDSSVVYRLETSPSENENYELHGDPSPAASYANLSRASQYSQESLVVPPLNPRPGTSNQKLGYYKSRSRESLRTGSLASISTVLSQQEASQAIAGSGALINLPPLNPKLKVLSPWADLSGIHPLRSHMIERPHQWSSQLSTVPSVSEGGTDRGGSRSWSDDIGRSSGLPSTASRHSRQMLSISSSLAQEYAGSDHIEPPKPAHIRNGQHDFSSSSLAVLEDQDEYGDSITDMRELRARPSRRRLSGVLSIASSDNGRSNTMLSTASSRANSILYSTIPAWARLYYGSGERRYLGALGSLSFTESSVSRASSFRASSFRSGSPNTDHFPAVIYSPRRRPRETNPRVGPPSRGSSEITPAPQLASNERSVSVPCPRRYRTWSMSSIWSPHLRHDRRAIRHSVWVPPSLNWSTEGSWFGRRNRQIVMFVAGFIFPFGTHLVPGIFQLVNSVTDFKA